MADIVMPRLSDTMEEGTILRWLKRDGETISRGSELVELETDKATMVYESDQAGVLQTIAKEGDTLAVGEPIARLHGQGEGSPAAASASEQQTPASAADTGATAATGIDSESGHAPPPRAAAPSASERVRASPLARRIARERGVDLSALTGSGPGGRIIKADVEAAGDVQAVGSQAAIDGQALDRQAARAKGETTVLELSRVQQTIARRMAESRATIPDFTLQLEVDMEDCVSLRTELKRLSPEHAPTYNDMVIKACAIALRERPRVNSSYRDGQLLLHARVNIGVAVAAGDALVVPTVFDAAEKSLGEIARETRTLSERVRAATITPPELGGGTFTVSNLGMYGVRGFTAIINPPQAAILAVGSVQRRAVVRGADVLARHTMTVTLACDHRILYGADAAELLARIRDLLEAPAALTL